MYVSLRKLSKTIASAVYIYSLLTLFSRDAFLNKRIGIKVCVRCTLCKIFEQSHQYYQTITQTPTSYAIGTSAIFQIKEDIHYGSYSTLHHTT